jgi:biotin transport system substrate-specific component
MVQDTTFLEVPSRMDTALAPTLLTRYLPRLDRRARDILLVFVGSIFIALMAQVEIRLPFTPVPITGQTFAVLLVGAALGSRRGAASLVLYLVEGALGLPAFAGGAGGLAYLTGATGGYLVGFVFAAALIGVLAERGLDRRFLSALPIFLVGEVVIYLFGVTWLSVLIGFQKALAAGLLPFLIGDAVKLIAAAAALPAAWKLVK